MSVNGQTRAHHNHKPWFFYSKCYSSLVSILASLTFLPTAARQKITQTRTPSQSGPGSSQIPCVFIALWFAVLLGVSCGSRCSVCLRHMGLNSHSPTQCGNPQQSTASHTTPNSMDKNNRNVLLCNFMGTASSLDLGELTRVYLQCSW